MALVPGVQGCKHDIRFVQQWSAIPKADLETLRAFRNDDGLGLVKHGLLSPR